MADTSIGATPGTGASIDARSQPGGDLRQVVTIGAGDTTPLAEVDAAGLHVRPGKSGASNRTSVAAVAASAGLLVANTARLGFSVFNESAAALALALGSGASLTDYTVRVPPFGFYEHPGPAGVVYTGIVSGWWTAADGNARLTELT